MKKIDISKMSKSFMLAVKKHSPAILTGIGVAGMIASTITAVRATPKALMLIEEKKEELNTEHLDAKETFKATWKCYIPSAVTGVLSASCIIFASSIHGRRNAALATAYSLSETAFKDYREKVASVIKPVRKDEKKENDSSENNEKHPEVNKEVIIMGDEGVLICEPISKRYFKSTVNEIESAVNRINRYMLCDMYVSLNDFYFEIGLDPTKNELGWKLDRGLIEVSVDTPSTSPDGKPCLEMRYNIYPEYDYCMLG